MTHIETPPCVPQYELTWSTQHDTICTPSSLPRMSAEPSPPDLWGHNSNIHVGHISSNSKAHIQAFYARIRHATRFQNLSCVPRQRGVGAVRFYNLRRFGFLGDVFFTSGSRAGLAIRHDLTDVRVNTGKNGMYGKKPTAHTFGQSPVVLQSLLRLHVTVATSPGCFRLHLSMFYVGACLSMCVGVCTYEVCCGCMYVCMCACVYV